MKIRAIYYFFLLVVFFSSCNTPVPGPDLKGIWKVEQVKEGAVIVYRSGASGNIYPGYSNFRMKFDMSAVEFIELSGEHFKGKWAISEDYGLLIFSELSPVPYGTDGSIRFTLVKWEAKRLVLRRDTPNPKTGGTVNEYTLVPE